ncbi:hypothetical protein B566_EDAN016066 [Ephemera danica]|nr:hypothetical protein B566_EDAN016066 [Ephemera danica]
MSRLNEEAILDILEEDSDCEGDDASETEDNTETISYEQIDDAPLSDAEGQPSTSDRSSSTVNLPTSSVQVESHEVVRGRGRGRSRRARGSVRRATRGGGDRATPVVNRRQGDTLNANGNVAAERDNGNERLIYEARTGRKFTNLPPGARRRAPQNIVRQSEGVTAEGMVEDEFEAFLKFISPRMLTKILRHTNEEARLHGIEEFCKDEMLAFIGISILMGVLQDTTISISNLWSPLYGRNVYIAAMSRTRFQQILKCIRFDDKQTRAERRENDKFAPLREIFTMFQEELPKYYIPSFDCSLDEMLSLFRGRCPFKIFMKDKPGKYGVIFRMLTDAYTRYVTSIEVYAGKDERPAEERSPSAVVVRLIDPINNSGRNVTTDRFYTSIDLAEKLWTDHKLTLVGTMMSNRKHIPDILKETQGREVFSSKFAFTDPTTGCPPVTLVSYIVRDKPKTALILLSTQHDDAVVGDDPRKKPEIVTFYNKTKGGVDSVDQMVRFTSCKRGTRRWPLSLFYTLIDIAALNAYTIYTKSTGENVSRFDFLYQLGHTLTLRNVERRSKNLQGVQQNVVTAMEASLKRKIEVRRDPNADNVPGPATLGRCIVCTSAVGGKKMREANKTKSKCQTCDNHVCGKHCQTVITCRLCSPTDQ